MRIQAKRSRILDAPNPDAGGTGMKRKFKLYNNRPSQRIDEMSANDLHLLKTKASSMANACGYADDDKGQNFWIGVEGNCEERLKELGVSTCESTSENQTLQDCPFFTSFNTLTSSKSISANAPNAVAI